MTFNDYELEIIAEALNYKIKDLKNLYKDNADRLDVNEGAMLLYNTQRFEKILEKIQKNT